LKMFLFVKLIVILGYDRKLGTNQICKCVNLSSAGLVLDTDQFFDTAPGASKILLSSKGLKDDSKIIMSL